MSPVRAVDGGSSQHSTHAPGAEWKALLPAGARLEQHISADLDADGTKEVVVLSSKVPPDLVDAGVPKEMLRAALLQTVHVFARGPHGITELATIPMEGAVRPLRVAPLPGGGRRRFVIAGAAHCGASCAGVELHVLGMQGGRVQRLLDIEQLNEGNYGLAKNGALETLESVPAKTDTGRKNVYRVRRYVLKGGELVISSERMESA